MPITFSNAPSLAGSIVTKTMKKIAPVKTTNTATGVTNINGAKSYGGQTNARMSGVLSTSYSLPTQQLGMQASLNQSTGNASALSTAINRYLGGSSSTGRSFNTLAN